MREIKGQITNYISRPIRHAIIFEIEEFVYNFIENHKIDKSRSDLLWSFYKSISDPTTFFSKIKSHSIERFTGELFYNNLVLFKGSLKLFPELEKEIIPIIGKELKPYFESLNDLKLNFPKN